VLVSRNKALALMMERQRHMVKAHIVQGFRFSGSGFTATLLLSCEYGVTIMTISVQLPPEEQHMLETAVDNRTPYNLGQDLFGNGSLAPVPTDSLKRQIREKLRAKVRQLPAAFQPSSLHG
jgi:hypothetical protein